MSVVDDSRALSSELVELRRALHREPEIGLDLPRTQEKALAALDGLPLEITLGKKATSMTVVLRGTAPHQPGNARTVLLRADMDALPVPEETGLEFAATNGAMHACGHDLHTAMLVGAAHLLCQHRHELAGDVVLMFQPGEEAHDGAAVMIEEGVLDAAGRRPDAAYGMHVFSATVPGGLFVSRPGPFLAAADGLHVTVRGRGGHGSSPSRAKDPVPAIAEMVTSLQTMVTRRFDVFDPVVISVGSLHAGAAANVIPETAEFTASVRTYSPPTRAKVKDCSAELLRGIAAAHGVEVDMEFLEGYPVTSTDPAETEFVERTVTEIFDGSRYAQLANPLSGSEDFSRVLEQVPGSFVGLSAVPPGIDPETAPFNHSPHAVFDDQVLSDGAALYAELALGRLGLPATEGDRA